MDYSWPNRNAILFYDLSKAAGHTLHSQSFLVITPKILLKSDVAQQIDALAQGLLLIGLPKKTGIVEASAQDALIAVANQTICVGIRVEDGEKMGQQLSVRLFVGEIFLVVAHHRDQDLFWKIEELRIEAPEDHRRKFGEVDDSRDERLVFAPARARNRARGRLQRFGNYLLSLPSA